MPIELTGSMLYRMAAHKARASVKSLFRQSGETIMKCVTYNVQYGIGMDGKYDLARIAEAVRGADMIAFQEISRNNPQNGGHDMVTGICELLPEYFSVFGAPAQMGIGSHMSDGKAVSVYFEFGNMVLSKTPILLSRNLLLPRTRTYDIINLQRSALEALIETPFGPVRFYSVHLDHANAAERIKQISFLKDRVLGYQREGGAVSGLAEFGFPEPPHPEHVVLMGDFNFVPESPEYVALCGERAQEFGRQRNANDFVDISMPDGDEAAASHTWFDVNGEKPSKRIDYCFASAGLAMHAGGARVDSEAQGSDHRPVWIEIE